MKHPFSILSKEALVWKRLASLLLALTLVHLGSPNVGAGIIAYEGFGYSAGDTLVGQLGGSGWVAGWVANGTPSAGATNLAESLSYTDGLGNKLQTTGGSAFLSGFSTANTSATPYRELPTTYGTDGTTTWISFLGLRTGPVTNTMPPFYERASGLQLREGSTERLALGRASSSNEDPGILPKDTWSVYFGGSGDNAQPSNISLSNAPATLLVLRIDHLAGNDDIYLFINPTLNEEPSTNSATIATNGNGTFNRIELFVGNNSASAIFAQMRFDEIRVGTTYADVTPYDGQTNSEIVYPSYFEITKDGTAVMMEDYATLPVSGRGGSINDFGSHENYSDQLGRPTFLRSEPANAPQAASRFFVTDLNRNLYILDKNTRTFTPYINFQSVFPKYWNSGGYAGGLNPIAFDPEYATNGIFYTAHLENPSTAGSAAAINVNLPGLDLAGYSTTSAINPPTGSVTYQSVLIRWTDTNINNNTFEGTAQEIMRIGLNSRIHPLGDLMFNPLAEPGDPDYRNLYMAVGDGSSGESAGANHPTPQRLDAVQGKILRITPDINLRPADELSDNGRYRIPTTGTDPNPFESSLAGLRKEIWAYGFRNCHRFSWDPVSNLIIENDIGLHAWEEVNIVRKGENYGYAEREGAEELFICTSCGNTNQKTGSQLGIPFPEDDTLTVSGLRGPITPIYPVALYSHWDGDGISSGFVYRGNLMPGMWGKYIFGDIPNGRLFYCDLAEMIAADDGNRNSVAAIHELQLIYDHPNDNPDLGLSKWRMFDVVAVTYTNRGGMPGSQRLPGSAESTGAGKTDIDLVPYGRGRADIRIAQGGDNEIYVISKSDGMIRKLTKLMSQPDIQSAMVDGAAFVLTWQAVPGNTYRVQCKTNVTDTLWGDLPGDVTANAFTAAKTNSIGDGTRFYRVMLVQ